MPIERKLAAIMFTDIAGYTEQMSKSEAKSLDALEKKRSILKPLLNEYKGTFVKEIGNLTNLRTLNLHSNQFTGEIPTEIGYLTNLSYLSLYSNQLTGEIPESVGQLTNLTWLWLSSNQFTSIHESICELNIDWENEYSFLCGDNYICNDIPDCIIELDGFNYSFDIQLLDLSYQPQNCEECEGTLGDINQDEVIDILDIVTGINIVLETIPYTECQSYLLDFNEDGSTDVLDIVELVNYILTE